MTLELTQKELFGAAMSLKSKKAVGFDSVFNEMFKSLVLSNAKLSY